ADLIVLRKTCRELEAASHNAFARAYFTNRKYLFTRYGLQALVDITKHPSLGRNVHNIYFVLERLSSYQYDPAREQYSIQGSNPPPDMTLVEWNRRKEKHAARRTGAWANWQEEAAFLDDEAPTTALIHQAFLALASLGTTTDIALTCSGSGVRTKQLLAAIGQKTSSSDLDHGDVNYASKCVLTAVVCSGLRSHKLMIGEYAELYGSLQASAFQTSGALLPDLHT
ncbi:hypothetical protein LTR22_028174, partial [Elasticomyces elasticus]